MQVRSLLAFMLSSFAGKGVKVGDDGEEVPAYYHQWASKIQDMSPARQADVLDQLGEDDRLIVQRILDHAAVQRSNDSALSAFGQGQRSRTHPASPTGSDTSPPPPYPGTAGSSRAGNSRQAAGPASSQNDRAGEFRKSAQAEQGSRSVGGASRGGKNAQQKSKSAADLGIFDFDSQSSSELEQREFQPRNAEARVAEAEPAIPAPQWVAAEAASEPQPQKQQQAGLLCDTMALSTHLIMCVAYCRYPLHFPPPARSSMAVSLHWTYPQKYNTAVPGRMPLLTVK